MDEKRRREVATPMPVPGVRRSKHSTIGPRLLFQQARARDAFEAVLQELEALKAAKQGDHLDDTLTTDLPEPQGGRFRL